MEQVIADVKTISLGNRKFYKPGIDGMKAVDLRTAELGGEYRRGALKVDRELGWKRSYPEKAPVLPASLGPLLWGIWGDV